MNGNDAFVFFGMFLCCLYIVAIGFMVGAEINDFYSRRKAAFIEAFRKGYGA